MNDAFTSSRIEQISLCFFLLKLIPVKCGKYFSTYDLTFLFIVPFSVSDKVLRKV